MLFTLRRALVFPTRRKVFLLEFNVAKVHFHMNGALLSVFLDVVAIVADANYPVHLFTPIKLLLLLLGVLEAQIKRLL